MKTNPNSAASAITKETTIGQMGLTKREHFAAMAMQGLWQSTTDQDYDNYEKIAEMSVKQADALIEALNKEKS